MASMSFKLLLAAVVLLLASIPSASGANASAPRVRKELRSLSNAEYASLLSALRIMINTTTAVGQAKYGSRFKEYDYFIVKHAVASTDPRGDQGHNGPNFMTFHRAWLLELERSLLAVSPSLKAIPYVDISLDLKGGRYYNSSKSVFSNKYVGAIDCASGLPFRNCQVLDGAFPSKKISKFNNATYGKYAWIYNGSLTTGLLRGPKNPNPNTMLTRFPNVNNQFDQIAFGSFISPAHTWLNPTNGLSAATAYNLKQADQARCTNASAFTSWMQWNYCADLTSYVFAFNNSAAWDVYTSSFATSLHAGVHWIVGGLAKNYIMDGDMKDTITSPNEPLMFLLHHANVDRSATAWQMNAAKLNASMATADVMWKYPKNSTVYPQSFPGCYLHDVITSNFPFSDIFDGQVKNATHFDLLNVTALSAVYTYDEFPGKQA